MNESVFDAFRNMEEAYEKFIKEAEEFIEREKERRMNLPPTLGK